MEGNSIISIIVTILFIGISLFTIYETARRYQRYQKTLQEFQSAHSNHEDIDLSLWPMVGMIVLAVLIFIVCGVTLTTGIEASYTVIYVCLGILFLALAVDNRIRYRCSFAKDGFFYEDTFYRFKALRDIQFKDGLFKKSYLVISAGSQEIPCTYKIGKIIQEKQTQWKKEKKRK
ncbi:MAG: hypothetical protein SPH17_01845 [Faecalicoccus sp.]|uniref:hypothetical protein n=1 Tax=Faecalicoccus sp. TaxID=1971758 RepID=UPI002A913A29|nr:hypothetical protein [Faecalicoccus sp.]MDY5232339.1 hypothetical protein [Faecalicoccus sp.]